MAGSFFFKTHISNSHGCKNGTPTNLRHDILQKQFLLKKQHLDYNFFLLLSTILTIMNQKMGDEKKFVTEINTITVVPSSISSDVLFSFKRVYKSLQGTHI